MVARCVLAALGAVAAPVGIVGQTVTSAPTSVQPMFAASTSAAPLFAAPAATATSSTLPPFTASLPPVLPTSAPGETLGCFHYGYAYASFIPNASTYQNSSGACQAVCKAYGPTCKGFSWWEPGAPSEYECDLAVEGHSVFLSPTTATTGSAVSGPAVCTTEVLACNGHGAHGTFPAPTAAQSAEAFDGHHVPTNAQCWPRDATGYPVPCKTQTVTVVEDSASGWPAKCQDLTRVYPTDGMDCETSCQHNVLCSVWQMVNQSDGLQCWQGGFGEQCFTGRPGFHPARSQRLMHGSYRVLKNLVGIDVQGLTSMFSKQLFSNVSDAITHCRNICISNLACQFWTYSVATGCWAENPRLKRVSYPLTLDKHVALNDTDYARAIVAGEYIQHYCGSDEFETAAAALTASTPAPAPAPGWGSFARAETAAEEAIKVPAGAVFTEMVAPAKAGDTKVEVKGTTGFQVGDNIMIGSEENVVTGFGSIYLKNELAESHPIGTKIWVMKGDDGSGSGRDAQIVVGLIVLLICGALAGVLFYYYKKKGKSKRGASTRAMNAQRSDEDEDSYQQKLNTVEEAPLLDIRAAPAAPAMDTRPSMPAQMRAPSYPALTQQNMFGQPSLAPAAHQPVGTMPAMSPFPRPQYQPPGYRSAY